MLFGWLACAISCRGRVERSNSSRLSSKWHSSAVISYMSERKVLASCLRRFQQGIRRRRQKEDVDVAAAAIDDDDDGRRVEMLVLLVLSSGNASANDDE